MASLRQALLLSSSNCHGYSMLEFAKQEICSFLEKNNVKELIFIPYAQNDFHGYTAKIKEVIDPWGFKVTGIHSYPDPANAVNSAKAIFMGGGNTFLLLKRLYENNLVELIRNRVNEGNLAYMGSSAGTNVATKSIHTTNDMPIIYPPSFDAINIVPFNINPHYPPHENKDAFSVRFPVLSHTYVYAEIPGAGIATTYWIDKVESEKHKGETRDQRIYEYMEMDHCSPVLGLREGSMLLLNGNFLTIKGVAGATLFLKGQKKIDYPVGADLSFLLNVDKDKL